jgi:hypothetical protein
MSKSQANRPPGARDEFTSRRIKCLGELILCELEWRSRSAQTTGNLDQLCQLLTALESLLDVVANQYACLQRKNTHNAVDDSQNDGGQGDE